MTARFNAPPGWQVPPGFRPEAGWAPDPAWPPAPADWEYWVEDAAPAAPSAVAPPVAPAVPPGIPAAEATTLLAPVGAHQTEVLRDPMTLSTITAPPSGAAAAGAAGRTRSVARQGAAVPLPSGPLGHLRGLDADAIAAAGPAPRGGRTSSDGERGSGRGASPYLIAGVAIACFAFGIIIGIITTIGNSSDAKAAQDAAAQAQEQVVQDRKDLNAQQDQLKKDQDALAKSQADLKAREDAVAQKENDLAAQQQSAAQQPAQQPAQTQQSGGIAGFQTCDQLRQEGVQTPIKRGDPNYSRLLDLDGNGKACE